MSEQEEFSRFMGRPVSVLEIFTLKRELTSLLHRQRVYSEQLKRRKALGGDKQEAAFPERGRHQDSVSAALPGEQE